MASVAMKQDAPNTVEIGDTEHVYKTCNEGFARDVGHLGVYVQIQLTKKRVFLLSFVAPYHPARPSSTVMQPKTRTR